MLVVVRRSIVVILSAVKNLRAFESTVLRCNEIRDVLLRST